MPERWSDRAGGDTAGSLVLAASQSREGIPADRCAASVNLVVEPCDDSLADRSAKLIEQSARLPGVLLDLEDGSLCGSAAVRSLFTYRLERFQIVVDQWLIVERGWAWCLSGGTDTVGFPHDGPLLEAIAATLELPDEGLPGDEIDGLPEDVAEAVEQELDAATDAVPTALVGSVGDLVALADHAGGGEVPAARVAAARSAVTSSGGPATDELSELLDPIREHTRQLTLQVDDHHLRGWIAIDGATVLFPDGGDRAVLQRIPTGALPVALVEHIPNTAAAAQRPDVSLDVSAGVLASLVATFTLPTSMALDPSQDGLVALANGLRSWWRLEIREGAGEASPRIVEGLQTADGPWRVVAHDHMVRLEPIRPRDVFRTLCGELRPQRALPRPLSSLRSIPRNFDDHLP